MINIIKDLKNFDSNVFKNENFRYLNTKANFDENKN